MDNMLGRLIRLIVTVPSEMLGVLCDLAEKLASNRGSEWYQELARFLRKEPCWVAVTKTVETALRHLFTFRLGAIDNGGTCPQAWKIFNAYFSGGFKKCGIIFSTVTSEAEIDVEELVKNGKFTDFLGSTASELEKRRLSGSQVLAICWNNLDKLRGEGFANFFVLTRGDEKVVEDLSNVFVARVYVCDGGELDACLSHVTYDSVWHSDLGRRIFSPQQ